MSQDFQRDNIHCWVLEIQILRCNPTEPYKEFVKRLIAKSSGIMCQARPPDEFSFPSRKALYLVMGKLI